MLKVIEPGLSTTVQDLGRDGYYHLGMPPSGAADQYSYQIGNILLGNPVNYAALEITLLGPKLEFYKKTMIVITGAPVSSYLNERLIPMWQAVEVKPGDVMSFKFNQLGVFSYLCVSGGIQVPEVMGSKSTYQTTGLGGFKGRNLKAGDEIDIGEPLPGVFKNVGKAIPSEFIPINEQEIQVRVVLGFASYLLTDEGVRTLLNNEWTVSTESSRIAYRCQGPSINIKNDETPFGAGSGFSNVVDTTYPLGGIVLPNSEEIILFLKDATTGGGFMTIGTVISPDLDLIAQLRPAAKIRFTAVTVNQAVQVRRERNKKIGLLEEILK
ncbi:biotin-dependent carboxyltransferase family protein [Bacillus salipaludis]|uniref:Biotin-dependent carboxyltransferase family protein n=1 Tax=Bacillus salipaludis TaxID=2547811 RepID=A0A4R5VL61_9BACI|nr:biotin-dependent carboxyltransferase family protein [Bacillus salipaludis]MDQ6595638.1 biotin-dependent carboxyltransferase family protein [Bacillus salipaludis]TDK58589.1 biotin-dependent carboxyltransferase family protein [Bacillus salipaludis]